MKQYELLCSLDGGGTGEPEESADGEWVRHDDVKAALKTERKRCLAECEKIHARGFRETAFECIEAILALEDE